MGAGDGDSVAETFGGMPVPNAVAQSAIGGVHEPSLEYELLRRRIESNVGEISNYFSSELGKLRTRATPIQPELTQDINQVLQLGAEHKRSLLNDMDRLRQVDGYEPWRRQEARDLSDLMQRRLHYLQNPKDCANARKLVCKLNKVRAERCNTALHVTTEMFCLCIAGLWVWLSAASCCLLFHCCLCDGAHHDIEVTRLALPQGWLGRGFLARVGDLLRRRCCACK